MNEQLLSEFKAFKEGFDGRLTTFTEGLNKLQRRVDAVEAEWSRGPSGAGGGTEHKTFADLLWNDSGFQQWKTVGKGRFAMRIDPQEFKTITSSDFAATASNMSSDRRPAIIAGPTRRRRVRSLLPNFPTTAGLIEYVRESSFSNQASPVAESVSKPTSSIAFAVEVAPVRTIAHIVAISRQAMDDITAMRAYLGPRMTAKLLDIEDAELLTGDGTSVHLDGLTHLATAYAGTYDQAGDTRLDKIAHGMLELETREYMADGIVLNPVDWRAITLVKDEVNGTNTGNYLLGGPGAASQQELWGVPVATTTAMPAGFFLVADFASSCAVFDRQPPTVEISDSHDDFFAKNLLAVRCEERISLAVFQSAGLTYGAF